MNDADVRRARVLYRNWFTRFPEMKNPTDLNRQEKFLYAVEIGWENYKLMQDCRKANSSLRDRDKYPFTKGIFH